MVKSTEARPAHSPDRVLTFTEWCQLNSISRTTGKRLIRAGEGPRIIDLAPRRIGIRESDNAAWQASRMRDRA
jgi:predicted DNA-binding transcriptional regulator AlpA